MFRLALIILSLAVKTASGNENSILWKIEGNGLSSPSYLFGTIHLIPAKSYFFPPYMKNCFRQTEILVMEIDLNISLSDKMKLAGDMLLPNHTTYKDYMDSLSYALFYRYLKDSMNYSENQIRSIIRMKPSFAPALLLHDKAGKVKTYEDELNKLAKKYKKPAIGLETIQEQMSILDSIPVALTIPDLDDLRNLMPDFLKMTDLYIQQNINALIDLMQKEDEFFQYEALIITNRNLRWIPKIEEIIRKKSSFIAVGCGHLPGSNGLIELLRNKGYRVTPVYSDGKVYK